MDRLSKIRKILGTGFVLAFLLGLILGPYKGQVPAPSSPVMQFVWAAVICGVICMTAQLMTEAKIPFPAAAIILIVAGGGLLTKAGVIDRINALTGAGATVTAVGCGNGAYSTGFLAATNVWKPFILTVLLDCILVLMGALCGLILLKKFSGVIPEAEAAPKKQ